MSPVAPDAAEIAGQLRSQAVACTELGSPLWGDMLERLAADAEAGGPAWAVLAGHAEARYGLATPLRLLGGAHRLALDGDAPALAALLPSCTPGVEVDHDAVWAALTGMLVDHREALVAALDRQVQTNETARAAALAIGLSRVQSLTGLPVRLLEIGTSAGLNLRLDRFTYGPGAGAVVLEGIWDRDPGIGALSILERAGCDPFPLDPTTPDGARTLESFVWPDQAARLARLRGAIELAREVPAEVVRAPAGSFVPEHLAGVRPGLATVVQHSIVWQYVPKDERASITAAIEAAGASATEDAPVAWNRLEPDEHDRSHAALTLQVWPQRPEPVVLAHACYHGRWVRVLS